MDFSRTTGQRRFRAKIKLRAPASVLPGKQIPMPSNFLSMRFHDLPNGFGHRANSAREGWAASSQRSERQFFRRSATATSPLAGMDIQCNSGV